MLLRTLINIHRIVMSALVPTSQWAKVRPGVSFRYTRLLFLTYCLL